MRHRLNVTWMAALLVACTSAPAASSPAESSGSSSEAPKAVRSSPSNTPSAQATPVATASTSQPMASIDSWEMAATFDTSPATSYVADIVAWSGGFLAVGSAWESEFRVGAEMPAMWTSSDGRSWNAHEVDLGVGDVTLLNVVERADGRLLLVGSVPGSGGQQEPSESGNVAWTSEDAVRWEATELPVSDGALVDALDHGPKGYILSARTPYGGEFDPNADATPGELWFSTDGIAWTKTYEGAVSAVAGDEGFVAIQSALAAGPNSVVASGDGQTWYPSELVGAPLYDLAALGGDWLAAGAGEDPATIAVLHSENGLDWTPVLDVNDLTGPDGPKTGRGLDDAYTVFDAVGTVFLAGGPGHAFLMLGNNHCCAQMGWTYGVWATTDGVDWTEAIPGEAFVSSVASAEGVTVLGGHVGRGEDATFWVGR